MPLPFQAAFSLQPVPSFPLLNILQVCDPEKYVAARQDCFELKDWNTLGGARIASDGELPPLRHPPLVTFQCGPFHFH